MFISVRSKLGSVQVDSPTTISIRRQAVLQKFRKKFLHNQGQPLRVLQHYCKKCSTRKKGLVSTYHCDHHPVLGVLDVDDGELLYGFLVEELIHPVSEHPSRSSNHMLENILP